MDRERRVVFVAGFSGALMGRPRERYKVGPGFGEAWSDLLARGFCSPGSVLGFLRDAGEAQGFPLNLLGEGVFVSGDDRKVVARTSGVPYVDDGVPGVLRKVVIEGDVGLETGDINFPGDVVIEGSVSRGYRVSAWGTVTVEQTCAGGVSCTEDLVVRGGINAPGATIEAGRHVFARFIENSSVSAKGDVIVAHAIVHSRIDAEGRVVITGPSGKLVGGRCRARVGVTVPVLGAPMGIRTVVELGVSPRERRILEALEKDLKAVEDEMDEASRMINPRSKSESLDVLRLKRYLNRLDEKRKGLITRIGQMKQKFRDAEGLLEAQLVLPGVTVVIGTGETQFFEETPKVRLGVAPSEAD